MARSRSLAELIRTANRAASDQGVLGSGNLAGSQGVGQTPSISGGLGGLFSASAGGGGLGVVKSGVTAAKSAAATGKEAASAAATASKAATAGGATTAEAATAGAEAATKVKDAAGGLLKFLGFG